MIHWVLLVGIVSSTGCATAQCPPDTTVEKHAHAHEESGPSGTPATGKPFRTLSIPAEDPTGPERQVHVLLDTPATKVVSIRLRKGVDLPEHTAPNPVIIQAISGAGTMKLGQETIRLDAEHFITLEPNVPHAVMPDAGTDLVLLVTHIRRRTTH